MIYLYLFITFFEIGLFGFGGGYGMLSLIQTETVVHHHWLSSAEFTNIVAVSQMTPGPIGINSATYCGYVATHNAGYNGFMAVLGSTVATFALVLPSLILMVLISKMFMKYMNTSAVQNIFKTSRSGTACRRYAAAFKRRELRLDAPEPLAILDQRCAFRRHFLRNNVPKNQSYQDDMLCSIRRTAPVILIKTAL